MLEELYYLHLILNSELKNEMIINLVIKSMIKKFIQIININFRLIIRNFIRLNFNLLFRIIKVKNSLNIFIWFKK